MILYFNYNLNEICKNLLQEQLDKLNLKYSLVSIFEINIEEHIQEETLEQLNESLKSCNIEIVEDHKVILVQKIRDTIIEMLFMEEKVPLKTSTYLADKLGYSYTYLSTLFSSSTYTTIESFIQLQKTERAKQLLAENELNVTEIGWKLNFSSTAHFSNHFKKMTGLTPSAFQRIVGKMRSKSVNG